MSIGVKILLGVIFVILDEIYFDLEIGFLIYAGVISAYALLFLISLYSPKLNKWVNKRVI